MMSVVVPHKSALYAPSQLPAAGLILLWLRAHVVGAVATPTTQRRQLVGAAAAVAAVPQSACAGCEAVAILDKHIISKDFYCHPDGSKVNQDCAAAHTPTACCAACMAANTQRHQCDAWFLNQQGGCFFKKCPTQAWERGECKIDPDDSAQTYHSGVLPQYCTGWGVPFISVVFALVLLYLAGGVAWGVKHQHKPLGLSAIPHLAIWQELGGLVGDGINFCRSRLAGTRAAGGRSSSSAGLAPPVEAPAALGDPIMDHGENGDEEVAE